MTTFRGFASLVLAASIAATLSAETHCSGNVETVPLHYVNGYQMMVAVSVNHSGPYDFLLDTGTQFTMVDPSLAAELHLKNQDSIPVDGTGFHDAASSASLDQLAIGSHTVAHLEAVVYSLQNLRACDLHLRGVLGEDFLQHFDMLIDNGHKMLCLDESSAMRAGIKGDHIALATPMDGDDVPHNSLILPIHLSGSPRAASPQARFRRKCLAFVWRLETHRDSTTASCFPARQRHRRDATIVCGFAPAGHEDRLS